MLKIQLLYSKAADYPERLKAIKKFSTKIHEKWRVETSFIDLSNFEGDSLEGFKTAIRSIPPQVRGRIVTSRNYCLPLSKGKNLNVINTPIAIFYDNNNIPMDVYPHLLGIFYIDIEQFMEELLRKGPTEYLSVRGLLEDPVKKILADAPHILEEGTRYQGCDLKTPAGIIDVLLKDKDGRAIIVEIETFAEDKAVSQVCRLANGYAKAAKSSLNSIRKAVVCLNYKNSVVDASKGAEVELYRVGYDRKV